MPATVPSTAPCGHQLRRKNRRIASTTATTMPCSTPRKMTPALATSESTTALRRTRHASAQGLEVRQRERGDDDDRGERGLREVGEQRVQEQQEHHDEPGADEAGDLALGARLLGDGGPRAARRDREALEEPGGDVRGPDADHLLVRIDLVAAPGGEARRGGDRVGQRDERDSERRDQQRRDVAHLRPGDARRREALRERSDRRDPFVGQAEDGRDRGRADHGDEDRRQPRSSRAAG